MAFNFSVTKKRFDVYSVLDPALDISLSDVDRYQATLDPKHLVWTEGETPTRFVVRPLDVYQRMDVDSFREQIKEEIDTFLERVKAFQSALEECKPYLDREEQPPEDLANRLKETEPTATMRKPLLELSIFILQRCLVSVEGMELKREDNLVTRESILVLDNEGLINDISSHAQKVSQLPFPHGEGKGR